MIPVFGTEMNDYRHKCRFSVERSLNCADQVEIDYTLEISITVISANSDRGVDGFPSVISLTSHCELAVELRVYLFVSLVAADFIDCLSHHCDS